MEQEYLLLDPVTGLPVPQADKVRVAAGLGHLVADQEVQYELLQAQVEVATQVCSTLEEVGGHLLRLRHAVGVAAEAHGCRIAACGTPPLRHARPVAVTDQARYRAMVTQAPQLVAEQLVNGMHVHVAVPDREAEGAGTEPDPGLASDVDRHVGELPAVGGPRHRLREPAHGDLQPLAGQWRAPVLPRRSGPRPAGTAPAGCRGDRRHRSAVLAGTGQLYWQARLSSRYPTVEVRCLDVQLGSDEAVMLAGLIRALVETALAETAAGAPAPDCAPELLHAAMWHAARHGLGATLIDPGGMSQRAGDVLYQLVRHVTPALDETGDTRQITALMHRLLQNGTGADRQRAALASGGLRAVTDLISAQSTMP